MTTTNFQTGTVITSDWLNEVDQVVSDYIFSGASGASGYQKPVYLGSYAIWVDSTGKLRIKSGVPASDTDGTVVGTQT